MVFQILSGSVGYKTWIFCCDICRHLKLLIFFSSFEFINENISNVSKKIKK